MSFIAANLFDFPPLCKCVINLSTREDALSSSVEILGLLHTSPLLDSNELCCFQPHAGLPLYLKDTHCVIVQHRFHRTSGPVMMNFDDTIIKIMIIEWPMNYSESFIREL